MSPTLSAVPRVAMSRPSSCVELQFVSVRARPASDGMTSRWLMRPNHSGTYRSKSPSARQCPLYVDATALPRVTFSAPRATPPSVRLPIETVAALRLVNDEQAQRCVPGQPAWVSLPRVHVSVDDHGTARLALPHARLLAHKGILAHLLAPRHTRHARRRRTDFLNGAASPLLGRPRPNQASM